MVLGVLGAPGGVLGRVWGPCGLQDTKKWFTSDSFDLPPPKLEPTFSKNRHVGVPGGNLVDQSVTFEGTLGSSCFRHVFGSFEIIKSEICYRAEPLFSNNPTVVLLFFFFFIFSKHLTPRNYYSILPPILASFWEVWEALERLGSYLSSALDTSWLFFYFLFV